jgi:hypothetical protein
MGECQQSNRAGRKGRPTRWGFCDKFKGETNNADVEGKKGVEG